MDQTTLFDRMQQVPHMSSPDSMLVWFLSFLATKMEIGDLREIPPIKCVRRWANVNSNLSKSGHSQMSKYPECQKKPSRHTLLSVFRLELRLCKTVILSEHISDKYLYHSRYLQTKKHSKPFSTAHIPVQ